MGLGPALRNELLWPHDVGIDMGERGLRSFDSRIDAGGTLGRSLWAEIGG